MYFAMESLFALVMVFLSATSSVCSCGPRCYPSSGEVLSPTDDAVVLARCHVGCVQKYASNALSTVFAGNPIWPSVDNSFLESYGGGTCELIRNVMECRLGCMTKANNTSLSRNQCRNECYNTCKEDCDGTSTCTKRYTGSSCTRQCKRPQCGGGCILYADIIRNNQAGHTPPPPLNPPQLEALQAQAGQYNIDSNAQTTVGNGSSANVTSFVFRMETPTENSSALIIFQNTLSETLDLSYFACEGVSVSFAAVNAYGVSDYSPATEICVHGENRYPSQPTTLLYTWSEDTREEFLGRAVVNVTWNKPEGHEYVTHYTLRVFSQMEECGGVNRLYTYDGIYREATNFILMADTPAHPPGFGCTYQITLQAKPVMNEQTYIRSAIILDNSPADTLPVLDLDCSRFVNKTTGKIAILSTWLVNASSPTIEAIDGYQIWVTLVDIGSDIPQLKKSIWTDTEPGENKRSGGYLVHNLQPQDDPSCKFRVRVTPVEREDLKWRQPPEWKECLISAFAEPPHIINEEKIIVAKFEVQNSGVMHLNMTWSPPEVTFGSVTSYEVHITREPLPSGDSQNSFTTVYRAETPVEAFAMADNVFVHDSVLCLYVQIRAKNEFLWSDWSIPVTLARYPSLGPNCTLIPSPTPPAVLLEPRDKDVPLFIYTVAGVMVCVIGTTLVMMVAVIHLCRKHRARNQMKMVFKEQGNQNPMFVGGINRSSRSSVSLKFSLLEGPKPDEWEIPLHAVVMDETLVGEGCFGQVHKATVKGPVPNSRVMKHTICMAVAIKFLKQSASGCEKTDFLNEIDTMKKVAEGNNRFVVNLIGCLTIQEPIGLITEFVRHGDLLSYLQTIRKLIARKHRQRRLAQPEPYLEPQPQTQPEPAGGEEGQAVAPGPDSPYAELGEVEPVNLISFAYQIASGMEYLTSLGVVHRDLACRNILVGENKNLKISDFGLSRVVGGGDIYVKSSKGRVPWKWMAIESILNREYTTASDVWAYGVTLWEIATLGGFPYPMIANGQLLDYLKKGYRLECPENCSREVYEIMLDCWKENPAERPTFTNLKSIFDAMLQQDNPYIQFDNINTHKPYYDTSMSLSTDDDKTIGLSDSGSSSMPHSSSSERSLVTLPGMAASMQSAAGSGFDLIKSEELPTSDPAHNPYVDTPTRPYDSSFDLDMGHTQQTIHEDVESGTDPVACETAV